MSSSMRSRAGSTFAGPTRFRCSSVDGQWQADSGDPEEFAARVSADTLIGSGSMGSVYRVTFKGSPAAGKTFHVFSDPSSCGLDLQQQSARELLAELAKKAEPEITVLMSILRHPSLCSCLGVGYATLSGVDVPMWIIMELADENLSTSLSREGCGPLSPAEALRRWIQLLIGLDVLHALGIVHRNIKPPNILLRKERRRFLLTDYGLARLRSSISDLTRSAKGGEVMTRQFSSGGKGVESLYQGPEGSSSSTASGRKGDTYAAAICLAEMLTGEEPSESHEIRQHWVQRASELLPNPASTALLRAASHDPKSRPAVAETLFAIFDSLTTIDLRPVRQAVQDHGGNQEAIVQVKTLSDKVKAWEELYQTAATARDELHEQLDAASSELESYRKASERREREVMQLTISKAEVQAETRQLREDLRQGLAINDNKHASDEEASDVLEELAAALSEQCKLAEEGERCLLLSEAHAMQQVGELGATAETHEEATTAILKEFAAAMSTHESLAAAGERRLLDEEARAQQSFAMACERRALAEEAAAAMASSSTSRPEASGSTDSTESNAALLLRDREEQLEEQRNFVEALQKSRLEQQHEMERLRSELAEANLRWEAHEVASAGAMSPFQVGEAFDLIGTSSSRSLSENEPRLSIGSGKSSGRQHRSNSLPQARVRVTNEDAFSSSGSPAQPQEESELQKVLNRRRDKLSGREKVFASHQTSAQTDASWKKKRQTVFPAAHKDYLPNDDEDEDEDADAGVGLGNGAESSTQDDS